MKLQLPKKLKQWIKPEIKRISIFEPNKAYLGMSKTTITIHKEHYKKINCYKKCIR